MSIGYSERLDAPWLLYIAGLGGTGATANCTVAAGATDKTDILADVRCFDTSGTPANPVILVAFYAR